MVERYEYRHLSVEIHFNSYKRKFFWTIGKSPHRFDGACQYFATANEAKTDCEKELDLMYGSAHADR